MDGFKRYISCGVLVLGLLLTNIAFAGPTLTLPSGSWELVAVPTEDQSFTFGDLTAEKLDPTEYLESWAIFTFNQLSGSYEQALLSSPIGRNQGFWMIQYTGEEIVFDAVDLEGRPSNPCSEYVVDRDGGIANGCAVALNSSSKNSIWSIVGLAQTQSFGSGSAGVKFENGEHCVAPGCSVADAAELNLVSRLLTYNSKLGVYEDADAQGGLMPWQGAWFATPSKNGLTRLFLEPPEFTPEFVAGVVMDGYIRSSEVFWRCSEDNGIVDSDYTTTDSFGRFTIRSTGVGNANCKIIANVPVGAVDMDRPSEFVTTQYQMQSNSIGYRVISPFTTVATSYQENNQNLSFVEVDSELKNRLALDHGMFVDYKLLGDQSSYGSSLKAQALVSTFQKNNYVGIGNSSRSLEFIDEISTINSSEKLDTFVGMKPWLDLSERRFSETASSSAYADRDWTVAPAFGLTEEQSEVIRTQLNRPEVLNATYFGGIQWETIPREVLFDIQEKMLAAKLAYADTESVNNAQTKRREVVTKLNSHYAKYENDLNWTFFSANYSDNLRFVGDLLNASVKNIEGIVVTVTPRVVAKKLDSMIITNNVGIVRAVANLKTAIEGMSSSLALYDSGDDLIQQLSRSTRIFDYVTDKDESALSEAVNFSSALFRVTKLAIENKDKRLAKSLANTFLNVDAIFSFANNAQHAATL